MINKIQTKLYFISLSIFIVLIDQLTNYLIIYNKTLFINKDFFIFKLVFARNYGAAFNILKKLTQRKLKTLQILSILKLLKKKMDLLMV